MKIVAILILSMFLFTACWDIQGWWWGSTNEKSWQEKAIEQNDATLCQKASYPDVCLLAVAEDANDVLICYLIKSESMEADCVARINR